MTKQSDPVVGIVSSCNGNKNNKRNVRCEPKFAILEKLLSVGLCFILLLLLCFCFPVRLCASQDELQNMSVCVSLLFVHL